MTLIGLPSTVPPKSSIAIFVAVTEPWPVGVDAGPFMSVSTPILTTSSEIWALAIVEASIAAVNAPSTDRFLANILSPPVTSGAFGRDWFFFQSFTAGRQRGPRANASALAVYFGFNSV